MPPWPSWRTIRYRPCSTVSGVSILAIIHEPCNPRLSVARYVREHKPPNARNHRRWTTPTSSSENLANRRGYFAVGLALAHRFDLHLGIVVRIARLLVSLLVHTQNQDRALRRIGCTDCTFVERNVSAVSATLRRLCIREAHDRSQHPAVSVFAREIHQATRLDHRCILWNRLRSSAQRTLAPVRTLLAPTIDEHLRSDLRKIA